MWSKYHHIAELLHDALVAKVAELLSQRTYVPNVESKYLNISESLHNGLAVTVAELLSERNICAKCEVKIL